MKNQNRGSRKCHFWYKNIFGDDFYLELMRHPAEDPQQQGKVYDNQVW
jgi:DNA polymerase III subunit alpha